MGFCCLPSGLHPPGLALAGKWQKPPLSLLRRYYSEKPGESKALKTFWGLSPGAPLIFSSFCGRAKAPRLPPARSRRWNRRTVLRPAAAFGAEARRSKGARSQAAPRKAFPRRCEPAPPYPFPDDAQCPDWLRPSGRYEGCPRSMRGFPAICERFRTVRPHPASADCASPRLPAPAVPAGP